jgi:putative hydrolase of the HAD superfamily
VALLLLDLDDTLIDRAGAFRRWARRLLDGQGLLSPANLERVIEIDARGRVRRWDMLGRVAEALGITLPYAKLLASYATDFIAEFGPHSVGEATLSALDRARDLGWTLGVVTNGDELQVRKIERAGLAGHLDGWCLSDLVGHQKPDPEVFRIAARQLGQTLEGAWMVGDIPTTDIEGAVAAGVPSVWIHHGCEWSEPAFRPAAIADSAAEAIELILTGRLPW